MRLTDFQRGSVTFDSWASAHSLTGANAAATADPDGDGLSNFQEYAFYRDPNSPDNSALTKSTVVHIGTDNYLALTFVRPAGVDAPSDLTYTPQRTTDLSGMTWSSADVVVQSVVPGSGSFETVTIRSTHPMNTITKEFLRVSVTKP
jgi:hypothetical protein